jgi:ABC-type polysaccharide/polyol phosphate transport system ATPase subunit
MGVAVIETAGLGKRYRLGEHGAVYDTLREALARGASRRRAGPGSDPYLWALRDLDLRIDQGEVVGVVGRNGAGKTTLLKLVARIARPTTGLVRVRGRVGALLEVGTGFHPELTGRENVFMNGAILGMRRREITRRFDEIVEFAGVEQFLDTPLKRYSSGMSLRLAFAVAAHLEPEVVVVDEVLAVGDAAFQRKCLGRMSELRHEGRTVLFVSHDSGAVGQLCDRAVWLDGGRITDDGPARTVLDRYLRATVPARAETAVRFAETNAVEALTLRLVDAAGEPAEAVRRDEPLTLALDFTARQATAGLDAALYVMNRQGARVVNENLSDHGLVLAGPPQRYAVRMTLPPLLGAGDYVVGVWIGDRDATYVSEQLLEVTVLPLPGDRTESRHGLVRPDVTWQIQAHPREGS